MNNYKIIDEATWERRVHCQIFRDYAEPCFCVTFEADITEFRRTAKEEGLSFTLAMVYAVCRCERADDWRLLLAEMAKDAE